jgi:hypothetical protein
MCLVRLYLDGGSLYWPSPLILSPLHGTGMASDRAEVTAVVAEPPESYGPQMLTIVF